MNAIRITLILIGIVVAFIVAGVVAVTLVYAHDTPAIRAGDATHDWTEYGRKGSEDKHWHYYIEKERSDGTIDAGGRGSWGHCVADAYDSDTDEYDLDEYGRCIEGESKDVAQPMPNPPVEEDTPPPVVVVPPVQDKRTSVNPPDPEPEIIPDPVPEIKIVPPVEEDTPPPVIVVPPVQDKRTSVNPPDPVPEIIPDPVPEIKIVPPVEEDTPPPVVVVPPVQDKRTSVNPPDPEPMNHPHVPGTMHNPCDPMPNPCSKPMPDISTEPIQEVTSDEPISTPILPVEFIRYVMTFPEGRNTLHLPIKHDTMYFTGLFKELGDGVNSLEALRPTTQRWTIVRSVDSVQNEWISEHRGFVADMETETTIELVSEKRGYGYNMIYVKKGVNLIGVPRDSDSLDTVGEFYTALDGVTSVQMMVDGEMVTPDDDDLIDPTIGYFVTVTEDDEFAVWGNQWVYEMSSPAPQIVRFGKVATTWGGIKRYGK